MWRESTWGNEFEGWVVNIQEECSHGYFTRSSNEPRSALLMIRSDVSHGMTKTFVHSLQ